jgi:cytochrome c
MRRSWCCVLAGLTVALIAQTARSQDDAETLMQRAMCYACHQMESASLGPPWRAIAARHAGRGKLMADVLASKIVHGGGGNWGLVPMVPNQRVTLAEARIMAAWVLEQAAAGE